MTATIRFLFPLSLLIVWAATSPPLSSEQSAQAELTRLEAELPALMLRGDATAVARLTADDFVAYDPQGRRVTKADILARVADPDVVLVSLTHEEIRIRLFGDVAVVTGISVVRGRYQGQPTGGRFRYTRVWVRSGVSWVAVAAHSSAIAE